MRIHGDGWKFVAIFAAVTAVLFFIHGFLGAMGTVATLWCIYFFRNPLRITPISDACIVSPADGRVVGVSSVVPPKEYDMGDAERTRISIFLDVFDVHVNRVPVSGRVRKIIYHAGQFLNASLDKASDKNERNTLIVDLPFVNATTSDTKALDEAETTTQKGRDIAFVQIAGLIARRIVCEVDEGDQVVAGEPFGLIRFGSRMDIYLPLDAKACVIKGQTMLAGETILATLDTDFPSIMYKEEDAITLEGRMH